MKKNAIGFVFAVIFGLVLPAYSAVAEIIISAPVSVMVQQASNKSDEAMSLLGLCVVIAVVIVMLLTVGTMIHKMNRKPNNQPQAAENQEQELDKFPKTHLSNVPVPITHNGHNYDFYPEIAEDGRYKTLYQIEKGRFMFVTTIEKFKESLRTSLKKDSNLVTELINQGRMRMRIFI